jgi:hypothetical protein
MRLFKPKSIEDENNVTFKIKVTMKKRWVPHFLGMLDYMRHCGSVGKTRRVTFMADGDGDFRPKFDWSNKYALAESRLDDKGDKFFDAG